MTRPRPSDHRTPMRRTRTVWLLPLCAALLATAVAVRGLHHEAPAPAREPALPSDARTHAGVTAAGISYRPGRVELPARDWRVVDRQDDVITWSEPTKDDAVTVAAIESSDVPLAAVVADVAATSRRLESTTSVEAPHELPIERGARGDSAFLLRMTLRDPRGRELHVRQIWRRDARAAQDVVATWTSRDDRWPTAPEDGIPEVDVR